MTPSDRAIVKSLVFFEENQEDFVAPIPDGYQDSRNTPCFSYGDISVLAFSFW